MKMQQKLIKQKLLLLCVLALLSACARQALIESEKLSYTEIEAMNADLKLEMIAPPTSKKLEDNLITSVEIEPFVVQGEGNKEFAQMINDKIIARINDGNYVRVVKRGGDAVLSGTLRIGQVEKFQEQAGVGADILGDGGEGQKLENSGGTPDASTIGQNFLGALGHTMLAGGGSSNSKDVAVKKVNVKRMSAILTYKLMKGNELIDSGDLKKELKEQQSAYVMSQQALAQENSGQISDPQMINKLLDIVADGVVAEISPHPQLFPFNWMESGCSGNDDFELGLKYARQSLDSEAEGLWKGLEVSAKDGECRSAALYNLALLKLRADPKSKIKQTEAYHMFVEADALNRGNDKYIMPAVRKLKRIAFTKFTPIDPTLRKLSMPNFGLYRLYVNATPNDSKISILNIRETYEPGIELKPGSYKIKVSAPGYRTKTKDVKIRNEDVTVNVDL